MSDKKFEEVKKEAKVVAPTSTYLTVIPKLVGVVQKYYKRELSSADKKRIVVSLAKELFPEAFSDDTIIGELIDLTFWLARNRELQQLLKKSCSCF